MGGGGGCIALIARVHNFWRQWPKRWGMAHQTWWRTSEEHKCGAVARRTKQMWHLRAGAKPKNVAHARASSVWDFLSQNRYWGPLIPVSTTRESYLISFWSFMGVGGGVVGRGGGQEHACKTSLYHRYQRRCHGIFFLRFYCKQEFGCIAQNEEGTTTTVKIISVEWEFFFKTDHKNWLSEL